MISALLVSTLLGVGPPSGPDVGAAIREVRRAFIEDGADRVSATPTHRVVSHPDGSLELQGQQRLRLSLQSVRRDRGASCRARALSREVEPRSPATVRTLRACDVEETWTNEPAGLAHAFTVQRPPVGSGGLTLRLSVDGPWHHQDQHGHVFQGPGAADLLRYGNAFVIREGRRLPISVVHVEGGLELRVPQALVDAPQAFPMLIDPILSTEQPVDPTLTFGPPPTQEETPAIAVNAAGIALVVWVDNRRQVGTDIFGARFNTDGGLADQFGLPLATTVGDQLHPTVCGDGTSFLVAWDSPTDGGWQVRARGLSAAGALTPEAFVALGSQPSLASMGDAGSSVLALVDPSSTVQVVPLVGTVAGAPIGWPFSAPEPSARPAIAASNQSWFVAWEGTPAGNANSVIRGMASWASAAPAMVGVPSNNTLIPARRPTVALGTNALGDEAVVFWEQGTTIQGVRLNSQVDASYSFAGGSPSLVRTSTALGVQPTLGYFALGALHLRDLNDGGISSLPVGLRPNDLVLAAGGKLYAAWTESSPGGSDVWGASLALATASTTQRLPFSRAASAQLRPRVALRDGWKEGLAVWIEGANVIRGAKVSTANGSLAFGSSFVIADQTQAIERLEVASAGGDDQYLVTWRQTGSAVIGQMVTNTGGKQGAPIWLSLLGANAGPAAAWDNQGSNFVVAWSQLQGLGFDLVSKTVSWDHSQSAARIHANGAATEVALTCLKGQCLLAWERTDNRDVQALLIGNLNAAVFDQTPAKQPAVAHDGKNFFLGWSTGNGLSFAEVDSVTGAATNLQVGLLASGSAQLGRLSLAPAVPPVVTWSELTASEESSVFIHRMDFQGPPLYVAGGMHPTVTTSGVVPGAPGVIVYQRYQPGDGLHAMRSFGNLFTFPFDAGTPDAGLDAGVVDSGVGVDAGPGPADGGVDAGEATDGGVMKFQTTGCGCHSASSAPLLLCALLALRRRRVPRNGRFNQR